jgi:hypothetical protein
MEYMTAKIAGYFLISAKTNYIRARVLRQSKAGEYRIIDKKFDDDAFKFAKAGLREQEVRRLETPRAERRPVFQAKKSGEKLLASN